MIKALDAVRTIVTVSRSLRPEYQTCFTKLHHLDARVSGVSSFRSFALEHQVFNAIFLEENVSVILVHVWLCIFRYKSGWNYARVRAAHLEEKNVRQELQDNAQS